MLDQEIKLKSEYIFNEKLTGKLSPAPVEIDEIKNKNDVKFKFKVDDIVYVIDILIVGVDDENNPIYEISFDTLKNSDSTNPFRKTNKYNIFTIASTIFEAVKQHIRIVEKNDDYKIINYAYSGVDENNDYSEKKTNVYDRLVLKLFKKYNMPGYDNPMISKKTDYGNPYSLIRFIKKELNESNQFKNRILKMFESENTDRKYWYHGDQSQRSSFRNQRMDRDASADELYNGPGIYFTEDIQEALTYAENNGYVYKVEIGGNIITNERGLTLEEIIKLIRWMPEEKEEDFKQEYMDENLGPFDDPDEYENKFEEYFEEYKKERALEYAKFADNNFLAPTINLYKEFYGNENANDFTNSLVNLGIDGIQVKFDDRQHIVVYNPKVIDIWDEMNYFKAYEKIYGDEDEEV